jgi:hypothetical protein
MRNQQQQQQHSSGAIADDRSNRSSIRSWEKMFNGFSDLQDSNFRKLQEKFNQLNDTVIAQG